MSESPANAIQIAVFNALDGSSELDSLLASHVTESRSAIYGVKPQPADTGDNSLFPYVTIGEDNVNDWSTDTASGAQALVNVHVWSRANGWRESKQISGAVYNTLHRAELTVPDHEFINSEWQQDQNIRDADGQTLHIVTSYQITIDEPGYGE